MSIAAVGQLVITGGVVSCVQTYVTRHGAEVLLLMSLAVMLKISVTWQPFVCGPPSLQSIDGLGSQLSIAEKPTNASAQVGGVGLQGKGIEAFGQPISVGA